MMRNRLKSFALFTAFVGICPFYFTQTSVALQTEVRVLETNFYNLELRKHNIYSSNDQVLVEPVSQSNDLFWSAKRFSSTVEVIQILSEGGFKNTDVEVNLPKLSEDPEVNFLILDLLSHRQYLYISHAEYFINSGKCSKAYITRFDTKERTFETIFRTNPCIGGIGAWTEFSGRLATDGRSLYSAWGNVYMDIYRNTFPRSGICCLTKNYEDSLTDSNYVGSVLKTDLVKKTTEKFASGFRNPQGLYYDSVRNILWLSDHGARGGDELNSIRKGLNYGYPYVSLGRPYLNTSLKTSDNPKSRYGTHSNFTSPVFSWTPSIAPSQVISVPSVSQFSDWWSKDIIVSSLKDKSLYRIRLSGNSRVMYAERIEIGSRIRDLSFSDSLIVGSTDDGAIFTIRKSEITPEGTFPQKS